MSPGSSTRTVDDLSPWAALPLNFAGCLPRWVVRGPGLILLDNSWLQLLITDALGVITQNAFSATRSRIDRCLPIRPPTTHRPPEGFVALSCAQSFGIVPRLTRLDADRVRPEPGADPLLGHDRAVACARVISRNGSGRWSPPMTSASALDRELVSVPKTVILIFNGHPPA